MIYLDNAATTLHKPKSVVEAVVNAMQSMGNSARGTHQSSLGASRVIYHTREQLARLFHCPRADHVVFTSNATEALNTAICGILEAGDHVITTDLEHNSVLRPLYRMERERGIKLDFVQADEKGCLDYTQFLKLICPDTRAIICTHASNLTGNLVDIGRIGRLARENGLLFIVDASQTAGIHEIDMQKQNIDVLCFTGHKGLMGPQGTGGLCVNGEIPIRPWKVGGTGVQTYLKEQPGKLPVALEAGTLNAHGIAGLSAALDFIEETGIDVIRAREEALMRRFYKGISGIPAVKLYGDFSGERAAIVAMNLADYDSGEVSDELMQEYEIATRPGGHCAPRMHEALGTVEQGAVRFSFSWFNTEEEIDRAVEAVKELCE